jgi:cobalamin biosynthesis Mg chelatase CobN
MEILSEIHRIRKIMGLTESRNIVIESKQTEQMSFSILKKGGVENPEPIVKEFASGDNSKNERNLPIMSHLYLMGEKNLRNIVNVVNDYEDLREKERIPPIQIVNKTLVIGDKTFSDFIKFSEFIHGVKNKYKPKSKESNVSDEFTNENKPLWSGNNIDIYDGNGVGKCISYTLGGLTGKPYTFCIGQPGNTMYKSYRDKKTSTFYFIVDKNKFKKNQDGSPNLDDPLHIVVFDVQKDGIELTDADNNTGDISEYGDNVDEYIDYLKSMGAPVNKLVNRPKTEKEEEEERLLGKQNDSLEWFKNLPYEYKSAYIGRGHALTDEQFDYLMGKL